MLIIHCRQVPANCHPETNTEQKTAVKAYRTLAPQKYDLHSEEELQNLVLDGPMPLHIHHFEPGARKIHPKKACLWPLAPKACPFLHTGNSTLKGLGIVTLAYSEAYRYSFLYPLWGALGSPQE